MKSEHERLSNARDTVFRDIVQKQLGTQGLTLVTNMSILILLLFVMMMMLLFGILSYQDERYKQLTVNASKVPMLVVPPNLE